MVTVMACAHRGIAFLLVLPLLAAACTATSGRDGSEAQAASSSGQGGAGGSGGANFSDTGGGESTGDPKTCEQAASAHSYVGCDFWPTVTANGVWSIFDYAAVVANAGDDVVDVSVSRGDQVLETVQIAPNALSTIYLPWVNGLKGPDSNSCGSVSSAGSSYFVQDGAYHLVSSAPVTVYQFNALEYQGQGGPPGKSWASCPGNTLCADTNTTIGCFSFSNDASLLIPSTAWTGNYRVLSVTGSGSGSYASITAAEDNTTVTFHTSETATLQAGGGVTALGPNQSAELLIHAGDVVRAQAPVGSDLSGTLIQANNPIQVIHGIACTEIPSGAPACDHIEETMVPAETLGEHYLVVRPTGPQGLPVGHVVRIYGNVNATQFTYPGGKPAGAPDTLDAGQVADLGVVDTDFEIEANAAFAVSTFLMGASIIDTNILEPKGDPSQSVVTAVEQFRSKYVFLAPVDYDTNYLDVVMPLTAQLTLDGQSVPAGPTAIGSTGFGVARVQLGFGSSGAHVLEASEPVGVQVVGYGSYTSYHYPGGLDLEGIAPPPVE